METILSPPQPFIFDNNLENVTSGNLSAEWSKWKKAFIIYFEACQLSSKADEKVQISIFLHVIGERCRDVYEQFENECKTLKSLIERFDQYFLPKKNLTIERHKFFTRNQSDGESIEQYAFELRKLASTCEFDSLMQGLIKDRLICGIKEDALRERLLREPDLTLKKCLDICNLAQMSKMQAGTIKMEAVNHHAYTVKNESMYNTDCNWNCEGGHQNQVLWVNRRGAPAHRGAARGRGRGGRYQAPARSPALPRSKPVRRNQSHSQQMGGINGDDKSGKLLCSRCGLTHDNSKCPAIGRRCLRCNNYDHFSRMCNVYEMRADENTEQVIYCCTSSSDWSIELLLKGTKIQFKLDTGADVNVLPCCYLRQIGLSQCDLGSTDVKLRGYSGSDIEVIGKCSLKVQYKERIYILDFIVADVSSPPILGRDSCTELGVVKLILAVNSDRGNEIARYVYKEYADIFEGVGCMPGEYKIELNNDIRPVVHAPRKLPVALKESVKNKLNEMVSDGIIAKVGGPTDWVNSLTVARKANGDIRLCLDPRDLNQAIRREHFKLPTLDEMTVNLGGSKFFSTLDAKQGFWQLRLHKDSTDLCTFNTSFGRYKFLRLPFGISSASEVFHKKMYEHFDDLEGVCLFVDDLLVYGRTKEEHDARLKSVLDRCREINLKLNKDKCKFGLSEIKYLGHKITSHGIYPDDSYTSAIMNMPTPKNTKDLERFLGMVNYVGSFIPNLSDKNHTLRQLLKKDIEWHWCEEHDRSFNVLKQCLTSVPVLQYYSLKKPVVISVDACKNGLGACLLQDNLPVCYASRSLTKAEQAYAQIEKELLACVYACEKFYAHIYGRYDITVETDHKPLVSIICKPIASAPARLQRMLLRLQPYNFKLVYKPGKYMYMADTLSRAVDPASAPSVVPRDQLEARAQVCAVLLSNPLLDSHFVCIQKLTQDDAELQSLIKCVTEGWPDHKQDVDDQVKPYWGYRDELTVAYGMAWKGDRIIIPVSMRKDMLRRVHIGHLGLEKCKLKVRESMFWPNINSQLEDFIKNCQGCLTFKNQNCKETLVQHDIPDRAWSKVGVDIFHFKEKKYLLIVDYYSKFIEVMELHSLASGHIIDQLKGVFSHQGIPDIVMSDNGPEFSSSQFKLFSQQWCFEHMTSSPRYAQSNGQVERSVQTVKNILKKTNVEKTDFRLALLEYLTTPITNTLASPTELLSNRKFRGIVPYLPRLLKPKIHDNITLELEKRQIKQKLQYDKTARDLTLLAPGQKVKVRIDKKWISGTILHQKGIRSYVIQLMQGGTLVRNRRHLILDSANRPEAPVCPRSYDDIIMPGDNANASAREPQSHAQHAVASPSPVSEYASNNNNYVTRSGRVVIPPDRY